MNLSRRIVAGLNEAPDPDARLNQIVRDLSRIRHVSITRQGDAGQIVGQLSASEIMTTHVPLRHGSQRWFTRKNLDNRADRDRGKPESLVITSHPDDEMAEIWDGILTQIEVGSAIAIVLFLITMVVVSRALAPIQEHCLRR